MTKHNGAGRGAVPFVVLTAGRSGSSFLIGALRSHPGTLCFGELLEEPTEDSLGHREVMLRAIGPRESVPDYCAEVVFEPVWRSDAVGFKLKYYHLEGNELARYLIDRNVAIIHNKRTNLIAQSLSLELAEQHDFADFVLDPLHAGRYHRPTTVDIRAVIARAEYNRGEMRRLDRLFKPRADVLDVYYEDICWSDDGGWLTAHQEVNRVLRFLGLEQHRLRSEFGRQRLAPYDELIENFPALRIAVLKSHPEWKRQLEALSSPHRLV